MIIIGIDPGTARTGYAIVEINKRGLLKLLESSVVETSADMEMHKRLKVLYESLLKIVAAHSPDTMVIEKLFFNTNAKTAIHVGQARGISMLVAAKKKLAMYEYTALEAKFVLTGYGRSDKKEMQTAVKNFLKLEAVIKPDDANDAVAIALCHIKKESLK